MAYIYPAPGVASKEVILTFTDASTTGALTGNIVVPALQDITVNNSNDVFTWTQLDETAKLQIATTATNSLDMNIVLDQTTFFGNSSAANTTMAFSGIIGLSKNKVPVGFSLYLGDTSEGGNGRTMSGVAYVTGLAPTVSADAPVWVSPITLTVTGEYTVT
jgi:hypothetical protein